MLGITSIHSLQKGFNDRIPPPALFKGNFDANLVLNQLPPITKSVLGFELYPIPILR